MNLRILQFIILFGLIMVSHGCKKKSLPTVTTSPTSNITFTTTQSGGNVTDDGNEAILLRGICWSTNPSPTTSDNLIQESTDAFTSHLSGLDQNKTYYLRSFATNILGTSYGNEEVFTTWKMENTKWDFLIVFDNTTSWHADVKFHSDGTTKYDEPSNPGVYTSYGIWSVSNDTLYYNLDANSSSPSYLFTGIVNGGNMSGTYTFGSTVKNFTAVKY